MEHGNKKPPAGTGGHGGAQGGASCVYFTKTGKIAATLEGRTLKKRVRGSVHMLRRPPAWAIDVAILEAARRDGAVTVEITDVETRRRYIAPIEAFDRNGIELDRGFGRQIALPLAHWRVEMGNVRQLALPL